jgi:hypothetical protein
VLVTVRTKARLYAVVVFGLLFGLVDISVDSYRHAMGKEGFLELKALQFDRMYSTPHPAGSLVFGLVFAGFFLGVYELIAAGLCSAMQARKKHSTTSISVGTMPLVERQLSSDFAPAFKYVLPVFAFPVLAAVLFAAVSGGFVAILFALIAGALGVLAFKVFIAPLRRVVATQHGLRVSDARTSVEVPYSEIEAVTRVAKRWDIIEVVFRTTTPFGKAIKFMAGVRFSWSPEHPVVALLRERAGLAPV